MKYLFGAIADEIVDTDDGKWDVKGVQHTFEIEEGFPSDKRIIPLCLCFRVGIEDLFQKIDLAVLFVDEQTGWTQRSNCPIDLRDAQTTIKVTAHVLIPFETAFSHEGDYHFDILLEEEKVAELPFEVVPTPDET